MNKYNDHICKECQYLIFDVLANARCSHPEKDAPIISEYLPACFRFLKNR